MCPGYRAEPLSLKVQALAAGGSRDVGDLKDVYSALKLCHCCLHQTSSQEAPRSCQACMYGNSLPAAPSMQQSSAWLSEPMRLVCCGC